MTQEINATNYWKRIDYLMSNRVIREFCEETGISYNTFRCNHASLRMFNVTETYIIANALGVTVEYLLTGKQPNCYSEELRTVIDILSKDTSKLEAVCTLLGIEKKKQQQNDVC